MRIEILGLPDERSAALETAVAEALERLGLTAAAEIARVDDMTAMIARGVRRPPSLRINGKVVCRRQVPTVDEIAAYLKAAAAAGTAAPAEPAGP